MCAAAALGDDRGAVAIDVKRPHRIAEAAAIVIEKQNRVDKGVRQTKLMAHRIGVAYVEIGLDQLGREIAAGAAVPFDADDFVRALAPGVSQLGPAGAAEWPAVDGI